MTSCPYCPSLEATLCVIFDFVPGPIYSALLKRFYLEPPTTDEFISGLDFKILDCLKTS
jgi:hypothetical protein